MLTAVTMWVDVIFQIWLAPRVMNKNEQDIDNAVKHMLERYGETTLEEIDLRIMELETRNQQTALELWREVRKRVELVLAKPPSSRQ